MNTESLVWFAAPGPFTDTTGFDFGIEAAAGSRKLVARVVAFVQGALIYDVVAEPFYGVVVGERADDVNFRDVRMMLERALQLDERPLSESRAPQHRVCVRCHNYTKLTVSVLRSLDIPARSRCGFGSYFVPKNFEDHWVVEYWNADEQRWVLVDAQLDEQWRSMINFQGDPLDLTVEEFVIAAKAWQGWRRGELDAGRFGLTAIGEHGAHWIAGNLRLDFAAMNKIEMLPWDVWGAGWEPGAPTPDDLSVWDTMSSLTEDVDPNLAAIRLMYASDDRVRMPGAVFNVLRQTVEHVEV